ncbi:MAG: VOC family protein [Bryobacteraceae bacterium]
MLLNPYLLFNGQCEAAFKFYADCLGAKIDSMMTFASSPMEAKVPPEWRNKVLHAQLSLGGQFLMGSDPPPGSYEQPKGFSVSLQLKDAAEAERVFNALAKDGAIKMPFQKTFWSPGFGMLVDRFGIPWMVNCDQAS